MKIFFYCQHVLGVGHFFRTRALCEALLDAGHTVFLLMGGAEVKSTISEGIMVKQLPPLMMDEDFSHLHPVNPGDTLEEVKKRRCAMLLDYFAEIEPDMLITELYPFGRKAFRFELDPLLQTIKAKGGCKVICSLRDILVEKKDRQRYENRVIETLNQFFHGLLVHSDQAVIRLDETFQGINEINIPIHYSGFVAPRPDPAKTAEMRRSLEIPETAILITVSIGGGSVGAKLVQAAAQAWEHLPDRQHCFLSIYCGPYMDEQLFLSLRWQQRGKNVRIERFSSTFLEELQVSDLAVNMAGYNTSMNLLVTQTPSLVWPFNQNREQRQRAKRMQAYIPLHILEDDDLDPRRLAELMETMRRRSRPQQVPIRLDGAADSAAWLSKLEASSHA